MSDLVPGVSLELETLLEPALELLVSSVSGVALESALAVFVAALLLLKAEALVTSVVLGEVVLVDDDDVTVGSEWPELAHAVARRVDRRMRSALRRTSVHGVLMRLQGKGVIRITASVRAPGCGFPLPGVKVEVLHRSNDATENSPYRRSLERTIPGVRRCWAQTNRTLGSLFRLGDVGHSCKLQQVFVVGGIATSG